MNTSDFIDLVKATGNIPTAQQTFTDQNILDFANSEIRSQLVPRIIKVRDEYFVNDESITIVANQAGYLIPKRAIGAKVREVRWVDNNGDEHDLPWVELDAVSGSVTATDPRAIYFKGPKLYLYPKPTTACGTIKISIFQKPNKLVKTTDAAQIATIDAGTSTVSVTSLTNNSITTGATIDFIRDYSPFDCVDKDVTISAVSGTDITFSSLPDDLAVGDWIALAQQSSVVQLPEEYVDLLVLRTALRVFEAQGNNEQIKVIIRKIDSVENQLLSTITPRMEGEALVVRGRIGDYV